MNKTAILLVVLLFGLLSCNREKVNHFSSKTLQIDIDNQGFITALKDKSGNTNYLYKTNKSPLIAIVDDGQLKDPVSITAEQENNYRLAFGQSKVNILLKIEPKESHVTFKVTGLENSQTLEAIIWGSYSTTIGDTIGECIGVVRNHNFAIGIQSLNTKTTAGKLDNIQGITSYHGTAAEATDFGSVLQAFVIDRTKDRTKSKWKGWINKTPGRPMDVLNDKEGLVNGSAISIFGCQPGVVLKTIGKIEVAEGLPHPEINGTWVKESKETNRAYVISPFSEENVDQIITYVKRAGLRSLYHEGPFETWGHFELDKKFFPHGVAGLKACVKKAKKAGLNMGVHTLTNFITPNDKFVTPVPDKRLVISGSAVLNKNIGADDTEIEVSRKELVTNQPNSKLNTCRIGEELIKYGSFSEDKPYILHDCERGAFGTKANAYAKGDTIVKLLDHAYKIFYPNWDMQKDVVKNITNLLNETGVNQMGFDGHEGCYATGQGDYAMNEFALDWYNSLDHIVVNSSSRLKHFYWHINHFINWGEPWYGGFRESQADRRFKVQPFLERNYLRNMLGWFMITRTTIPSDIEWMMARAAGYNAGFAMVLRLPELNANPHTGELLDLIRIWEQARLAGAFSTEQRERLKNGNNEFHLKKTDDKNFILQSYKTNSFEHTKKVLQPGEPTDSDWTFNNSAEEQPLMFRLTVKGKEGQISKPILEFDRSFTFHLPDEIEAGYSLVCDGSAELRIYDNKGRFRHTFNMGKKPPMLRKGAHHLRFECNFGNNDDLAVNVVVKQKGKDEPITLTK